MTLIDALFINKGGGAVLLQYLIEAILARPERDNFFFLLDPRFEKPANLVKNFEVVPNKMAARNQFYRQRRNKFSKALCFANIPPPVRLSGKVYTYFHNQKLVEAPRQATNPKYLKLLLKYVVIRWYNSNTDYYVVQTPHMVKEITGLGMKNNDHTLMIPFYDDRKYKTGQPPFAVRPQHEFVFISNPSPQKNYPTLLNAWEVLLARNVKPVLHVTVDNTAPEILDRISALNARGANIRNHVYVDPRELYYSCPYLIFPSVMESFGLPLIEATESGMKVLASDLPYVSDVIKPSLTFQPLSKQSIADAVLRAMQEDLPFPQLLAKNEVEQLISLLV